MQSRPYSRLLKERIWSALMAMVSKTVVRSFH